MNRLRTAVDEHYFRAEGDYDVLGGKQTLGSFIVEWREHYAKVHDLDFASINPMLRAIDRAFGSYTLEYLQNASLQIERWLNELQRARGWADNTWNLYYQMFNSLFVRAIKWKQGTIARMTQNPMTAIDLRVGCTRRFRVRIEESVEDRLFAACDRLDDLVPSSWTKLDWEKAAEIRRRAAAGEAQAEIAAAFGISVPLCCQVIGRKVWNDERPGRHRKGNLMRLRLMMAFDSGARREEMMKIRLKHIDFNPLTVMIDGKVRELLVIEVQSKGEKFTGEKERVYAGTERLITGRDATFFAGSRSALCTALNQTGSSSLRSRTVIDSQATGAPSSSLRTAIDRQMMPQCSAAARVPSLRSAAPPPLPPPPPRGKRQLSMA